MQQTAEYPGVTRPHLVLAKAYSSPALSGPPMCDELVALMEHMFTDEEAAIVQHIKPFRAKSAANLARQAQIRKLFPIAREAEVRKWKVVRERQGVYRAYPGMEKRRPYQRSPYDNFYLTGDYTKTHVSSGGMEAATWTANHCSE